MTSQFLGKLDVEQVEDTSHDGRGTWRLLSPLVYASDLLKQTLTVPAGFVTDFATVPRIPILFDLLGDRGNEAATLHDWLYTPYKTGAHPVADRATADKLLREALVAQGVSKTLAMMFYLGVRVGGASYWK